MRNQKYTKESTDELLVSMNLDPASRLRRRQAVEANLGADFFDVEGKSPAQISDEAFERNFKIAAGAVFATILLTLSMLNRS